MKATFLLKKNIEALLSARGQSQHDLASWCRRSDAWISKILSETSNPKSERGVPLRDLDRIADFFGLAAYQLFQPGISPLTERRKGGDRRSGRDRRVSHLTQELRGALSPANAHITEEDIADLIRLRTISAESRVQVRQDIDALARSEREAVARTQARRGAGRATGTAGGTAARVSRRPPARRAGEG